MVLQLRASGARLACVDWAADIMYWFRKRPEGGETQGNRKTRGTWDAGTCGQVHHWCYTLASVSGGFNETQPDVLKF